MQNSSRTKRWTSKVSLYDSPLHSFRERTRLPFNEPLLAGWFPFFSYFHTWFCHICSMNISGRSTTFFLNSLTPFDGIMGFNLLMQGGTWINAEFRSMILNTATAFFDRSFNTSVCCQNPNDWWQPGMFKIIPTSHGSSWIHKKRNQWSTTKWHYRHRITIRPELLTKKDMTKTKKAFRLWF